MDDLAKLSKNEKRGLKHEQRKQEKFRMQQETKNKAKIKKAITIAVLLVFAGSVFSLIAFFGPQNLAGNAALNTNGMSFPLGKIHWHATPKIELCGEPKQIPVPASDVHLGSALLHTHQDALIHIEGTVSSPSQILLGGFFDNIGVNFSQTQIFDKTNGDSCQGGAAGKVTMSVNGIPSSEFRDYVIRDGDKIEIKFE